MSAGGRETRRIALQFEEPLEKGEFLAAFNQTGVHKGSGVDIWSLVDRQIKNGRRSGALGHQFTCFYDAETANVGVLKGHVLEGDANLGVTGGERRWSLRDGDRVVKSQGQNFEVQGGEIIPVVEDRGKELEEVALDVGGGVEQGTNIGDSDMASERGEFLFYAMPTADTLQDAFSAMEVGADNQGQFVSALTDAVRDHEISEGAPLVFESDAASANWTVKVGGVKIGSVAQGENFAQAEAYLDVSRDGPEAAGGVLGGGGGNEGVEAAAPSPSPVSPPPVPAAGTAAKTPPVLPTPSAPAAIAQPVEVVSIDDRLKAISRKREDLGAAAEHRQSERATRADENQELRKMRKAGEKEIQDEHEAAKSATKEDRAAHNKLLGGMAAAAAVATIAIIAGGPMGAIIAMGALMVAAGLGIAAIAKENEIQERYDQRDQAVREIQDELKEYKKEVNDGREEREHNYYLAEEERLLKRMQEDGHTHYEGRPEWRFGSAPPVAERVATVNPSAECSTRALQKSADLGHDAAAVVSAGRGDVEQGRG